MGWYRAQWQAAYRATWLPEPGIRDTIDTLLFACSDDAEAVDSLKAAIGRYFQDREPFLVTNKHALRFFLRNPNKYRGVNGSHGMNAREVRGAENVNAWVEFHERRDHGAR